MLGKFFMGKPSQKYKLNSKLFQTQGISTEKRNEL